MLVKASKVRTIGYIVLQNNFCTLTSFFQFFFSIYQNWKQCWIICMPVSSILFFGFTLETCQSKSRSKLNDNMLTYHTLFVGRYFFSVHFNWACILVRIQLTITAMSLRISFYCSWDCTFPTTIMEESSSRNNRFHRLILFKDYDDCFGIKTNGLYVSVICYTASV